MIKLVQVLYFQYTTNSQISKMSTMSQLLGRSSMILKQNINLEWRMNRVSPSPGPQKCFTSFSNF